MFVLKFFGYIFLVVECVYHKRLCMLDTKKTSSLTLKQWKTLLKVYDKKDIVIKDIDMSGAMRKGYKKYYLN